MIKARYSTLLLATLLLSSCGETPVTPVDPTEDKSVSTYVYRYVDLPSMEGKITYTYEGNDIIVDETNNKVCGTLANTSTLLKMSNGSKTYNVTVKIVNRAYSSKHAATETSEGWFNDVNVERIFPSNSKRDENMASFAAGMDVSSAKKLYDANQKFYNRDGVEESLFRILKDSGVNWVRLRLWNDPTNHNFVEDGKYVSYGGGSCDLESVTWMAKEAKRFGLKFYLDIHYSDFWADPNSQIIPKAWASFTTSDQMANAIKTYTTDVLIHLKDNNATPDMVSLGNETTSGLLLHLPGADYTSYSNDGNPGYDFNKSAASNAIAGKMGSANFVKYIKAANDAVKTFDSKILTMVHVAKGLTAVDTIKGYYNNLTSVNYDVIGLSAYAYGQWNGRVSVLSSGLEGIASAFPTKKICIAETSYGYTFETDNNVQNNFKASDPDHKIQPVGDYTTINIQTQAQITRDAMNVVANLSNGLGCFYWEGAWTATAFCGWGDKTSKCVQTNQSLFSYNGRALGSLDLYNQIW